MKRLLVPAFIVCMLVVSCAENPTQVPAQEQDGASVSAPVVLPTQTVPALAAAPVLQPTATQKPRQFSPITPAPTRTITPTSAPSTAEVEASAWKELPVIPETIDASLQRVYERGIADTEVILGEGGDYVARVMLQLDANKEPQLLSFPIRVTAWYKALIMPALLIVGVLAFIVISVIRYQVVSRQQESSVGKINIRRVAN